MLIYESGNYDINALLSDIYKMTYLHECVHLTQFKALQDAWYCFSF